jgi:hypothetical protein
MTTEAEFWKWMASFTMTSRRYALFIGLFVAIVAYFSLPHVAEVMPDSQAARAGACRTTASLFGLVAHQECLVSTTAALSTPLSEVPRFRTSVAYPHHVTVDSEERLALAIFSFIAGYLLMRLRTNSVHTVLLTSLSACVLWFGVGWLLPVDSARSGLYFLIFLGLPFPVLLRMLVMTSRRRIVDCCLNEELQQSPPSDKDGALRSFIQAAENAATARSRRPLLG